MRIYIGYLDANLLEEEDLINLYRPRVSVIASPLMTVSHYCGSNLPREKASSVRL